jgi:hypothetical protein
VRGVGLRWSVRVCDRVIGLRVPVVEMPLSASAWCLQGPAATTVMALCDAFGRSSRSGRAGQLPAVDGLRSTQRAVAAVRTGLPPPAIY